MLRSVIIFSPRTSLCRISGTTIRATSFQGFASLSSSDPGRREGRGSLARVFRGTFSFWQQLKQPNATTAFRVDDMSVRNNLMVYREGGNRFYIGAGIITTSISLVFAFGFAVHHLLYAEALDNPEEFDQYDYMQNSYMPVYVLFGAILIFCAKMQTAFRGYVVRMYYNHKKREFTLIKFNPFLPWKKVKLIAKPGDAVTSDIKVVSWLIGNCLVAGRRCNLRTESYKFPIYQNVLFGHTKPEALDEIGDTNNNADEVFKKNRR